MIRSVSNPFVLLMIACIALIAVCEIAEGHRSRSFREFRRSHKCAAVGVSRYAGSIAWTCDDGSTWTVETDNGR